MNRKLRVSGEYGASVDYGVNVEELHDIPQLTTIFCLYFPSATQAKHLFML